MTETKGIFQSKGVKGAVITVILAVVNILKVFGVEIDLDEGMITEMVGSFAFLIGGLWALYGRIVAKHRIE